MKKEHLTRSLIILFAFFMYCNFSFGQEFTVSGTVKDDAGSPIPGVTILIKGSTKGTTSDIDGKYSIKAETNSVLVFSFVGYSTEEIPVNGRSVIDIVLKAASESLDEVVVIGYGTVKKTDLTGSITSVSSKDFNKGAISSPQDLLIGKTSGVVITQNDGAPGAGATIRIRGGSSINASNDPLIVIDGFPVDNKSISGIRNPLSAINPNDIESFTVLKDASATAIYGSRASNGVIIITTKKGESKFKVSYNGSASVNVPTAYIDVLNAREFRTLIHKKYGYSSNAWRLTGNSNTNWQKEIFHNSSSQDHNLSVSGTNFNIPYRVSLGYSDQNGLLRTTSMQRTTLSVGLNPSLFKDHLKIGVNAKGMNIDNNFGNSGAIGAAMSFDPTQSVHETNAYGNYFAWLDGDGTPQDNAPANPVALLEQTDNTSNAKRFIGNFDVDYKIHFLPDLHLKITTGFDYTTSEGSNIQPITTAWQAETGGYKNNYFQNSKSELFDSYLNYKKNLELLSSEFDVTAGYSYQHFWTSKGSTTTQGTTVTPDPFKTENFLISFFGRLNYSFKGKYLLTATIRDDGSSRFKDHWGLFPSAALAWKINEEAFIKNISVISDLKLRLGYGITGQQDIGNDYGYIPYYKQNLTNAQYQFGSTFITPYTPQGYDENLKWEQTTTYNIGLNFGLFNNRLNGTVDVYSRKTIDALNVIPVSGGTNFTNSLLTNVGDISNKGVEVSLNIKPIASKNLFWEIGFNATYNKNEITKLTKVSDPSYPGVLIGGISGAVGNTIQVNSVGHPINSFFVTQQVYDVNGRPIEGLYADLSGLGTAVASDVPANRYRYKKAAPDFVFGFSTRVNYKNWDLAVSARANVGNYVYNNNVSSRSYYENLYWPGTVGYLNNMPKAVTKTNFKKVQYYSDYYIENASFLKIDNISFGYTFKNIVKSIGNVHITGTVQNVLTITNYSGLDPEVDGGIDNNIYPRSRTFIIGLSIDL
ncbi:MAG TPA: SusC/RagA family protein [Bacteroidales bacterium]|nr:SusC/RagA family protein [Bacteroidales bacterium]